MHFRFTDENRTWWVMKYIVANTAENRPSEHAHSSTSGYDQITLFPLCDMNNGLPWVSTTSDEFPRYLWKIPSIS